MSFFPKILWARLVPGNNLGLEALASWRWKGKSQLAQKHSWPDNRTADGVIPSCRSNQSFATKGFSWVSYEDKLRLRGILLPVGLINMIICCFISCIFHGKCECVSFITRRKHFTCFSFFIILMRFFWKLPWKGMKMIFRKPQWILLSFMLNALLLNILRTEHQFCLKPFSTSFSSFKTRGCHWRDSTCWHPRSVLEREVWLMIDSTGHSQNRGLFFFPHLPHQNEISTWLT